ncbi:MAG: hypothetical protein MI861_06790 [Pirellulales bacterium]|nr:hypothetical protein [Pirellulales bacterium]
MKTTLATTFVAIGCLALSGCIKPYDVPEYHEVGASHTAFLVPLEGDSQQQAAFDSEEFLAKNMVATKRVQIPHLWVQTGRMPNSGQWVDSMRLITIDRAPVTREWNADTQGGTSRKDEAIWVESRDSVGFSTGIACTARISSDKDAIKFLYNYPAATSTQSSGKANQDQIVDTGLGLAHVMDSEIRAQVQSRMSDFAALYNMDELREKKPEMLAYVRHGMLPENVRPPDWNESNQPGVIDFFKERGIEITTLGQFGGFTYENAKIQDAIDRVFEAQQDEEVAKAEATAQRERNVAVQLEAEGLAEAARLRAKGEADAIQAVADAKAYEIEKAQENWEQYLALKQLAIEESRLEKWDGSYPQSYFGGDLPGLGSMILQPPVLSAK